MEQILFVVNGENLALTIESDDLTAEKLKSDDDFARTYILELINNGFISLTEPLNTIARMHNNEEILIYSSNELDYESMHTDEADEKEKSSKTEWSDSETKFLLDLYEQNIPRVGPMKKFKNKKSMWEDMATMISSTFKIKRTGTQTENRYKTILKRKKAAIDNNASSGALRKEEKKVLYRY